MLEGEYCLKGGSKFTDESVMYGEGEKFRIYMNFSIFYCHHVPQCFGHFDFDVLFAFVDASGPEKHAPSWGRNYLLPEAKARGRRLAGFGFLLLYKYLSTITTCPTHKSLPCTYYHLFSPRFQTR
jgi:hypothetical protein